MWSFNFGSRLLKRKRLRCFISHNITLSFVDKIVSAIVKETHWPRVFQRLVQICTDKKSTKRYILHTSQHLCCDSDIGFAPCCGGCSSLLCWPFLVSAQLKRHAITVRFLFVRKGRFDALHSIQDDEYIRMGEEFFVVVEISQIQRFKWNLMRLLICWQQIVISASFHPLFSRCWSSILGQRLAESWWSLLRSSSLQSQML